MYQYSLQNLVQTNKFAEKMAFRLQKGGILFLYGELGAGKTALTKEIVSFLDKKIKIKSPTYTLMQEYELPYHQKLYHLDLYRLIDFDEIYQIGYEEILANAKHIVIFEWAERIPERERPQNYFAIHLKIIGESQRKLNLEIKRANTLSHSQIESLLNEFQTPQNVRKHAELVAKVSQSLGKKLIQKGEIVDLQLLYEAAMLHDLVRVVDFYELKKDNFQEKITPQKWQKWQELRQKYKGRKHAQVAQEILTKRGYKEIANIIRRHCTSCILGLKKSEELITWEDKLLYYADKRVKHDQIVDLETRFRIGREENGHLVKSLAKSVEIEARANALENEIFEITGRKFELELLKLKNH